MSHIASVVDANSCLYAIFVGNCKQANVYDAEGNMIDNRGIKINVPSGDYVRNNKLSITLPEYAEGNYAKLTLDHRTVSRLVCCHILDGAKSDFVCIIGKPYRKR